MGIYSAKHAKELLADSMRIDPSYTSPTGVRIRAVLQGETKERVFHVADLLADDGRREIDNAVNALRSRAEINSSSQYVREAT